MQEVGHWARVKSVSYRPIRFSFQTSELHGTTSLASNPWLNSTHTTTPVGLFQKSEAFLSGTFSSQLSLGKLRTVINGIEKVEVFRPFVSIFVAKNVVFAFDSSSILDRNIASAKFSVQYLLLDFV